MRFVGLCLRLWISMTTSATSPVRVAEVDGSAFRPLPYQSPYINNDSRFYMGLWARQTGKSTGVAVKKVDKAMKWEVAGRKYFCLLASAGERQSRELFEAAPLRAKKFVSIPDVGHNDPRLTAGAGMLDEIARFLSDETARGDHK